MNILVTFNFGEEKCEHDWSYDKPEKLNMTKPVECLGIRICRKCGRMERFIDNEIRKPDKDFNKTFKKFV